jgi:hypothetical protein
LFHQATPPQPLINIQDQFANGEQFLKAIKQIVFLLTPLIGITGALE